MSDDDEVRQVGTAEQGDSVRSLHSEQAPSIKATKRRRRVTDAEKAQAGALLAAGASHESIAVALGVSATAARNAARSPIAVALQTTVLRDTIATAKARLADKAERASERLGELLESDRDDTALRASNSILDRVGVGASSTVRHVREQTAEELAASYAEALRILRAAGELP